MSKEHSSVINFPVETISEKPKKGSFQVYVNGQGWNILGKKMGLGLEPILVKENTEKVLPQRHLKEIATKLKGFAINYIAADTVYLTQK